MKAHCSFKFQELQYSVPIHSPFCYYENIYFKYFFRDFWCFIMLVIYFQSLMVPKKIYHPFLNLLLIFSEHRPLKSLLDKITLIAVAGKEREIKTGKKVDISS